MDGGWIVDVRDLTPAEVFVHGLGLTGSFDGDLEFSSSCSFGVNPEVGGLLHPQAFWLQATPLGAAQGWITGCRQEVRSDREIPMIQSAPA